MVLRCPGIAKSLLCNRGVFWLTCQLLAFHRGDTENFRIFQFT